MKHSPSDSFLSSNAGQVGFDIDVYLSLFYETPIINLSKRLSFSSSSGISLTTFFLPRVTVGLGYFSGENFCISGRKLVFLDHSFFMSIIYH